jgi:hypothetical protein
MKIKKVIFSLFLLAVFSAPAGAVEFVAGAKGGYFLWKPYFEDIGGFFEGIDRGNGVLYGPAVSVIFTEDISLSVVGFTGLQTTFWSMDFKEEGSPDDVRAATYTWESDRYDIDAALSYSLMPSLKVFAGYKYQYIVSTMRYTEVRVDSSGQMGEIYHDKMTLEAMSNGPALGVGYSLLFGKGFFTAVNLSGLYMQGYFKMDPDFAYGYNSSTNEFDLRSESETKVNVRQLGTNIEPSVGYMTEGSKLIFTLGLRFQWLNTELYDLTDDQKQNFGTETMNDYLYGVFVSVLYSF